MTASLHRMATMASVGGLLGALAALLSALADYGAHFLWLDTWTDRGVLLLRLLGTQLPVGTVLGLVLGTLLALSERWHERLSGVRTSDRSSPPTRSRAVQLTAVLAPWPLWIGSLLFTGGKMSRLPARAAW